LKVHGRDLNADTIRAFFSGGKTSPDFFATFLIIVTCFDFSLSEGFLISSGFVFPTRLLQKDNREIQVNEHIAKLLVFWLIAIIFFVDIPSKL
jgi:hypothetical protein